MRSYNEPGEPARTDTEITLGMRSILGIFFGLVIICGIFFGLGYSVGHSGFAKTTKVTVTHAQNSQSEPATPLQTVVEQPNASAQTATAGGLTTTAQAENTSSQPKPSAATVAPSAPAPAPVAAPPPSAPVAATVQRAAYHPQAATQPVSTPHKAARAASEPPIQHGRIMVQIAAVSRRQDAEALVAALRKAGYTPVVRPGVDDHLLHVQVGPFLLRSNAEAMRTKLMRSGYNAILK